MENWNTRIFGLFIGLIMGSLTSLGAGCASAPRIPATSLDQAGKAVLSEPTFEVASSEDPTAERSDWLTRVPGSVSAALCLPKEMFRACYPISEPECLERAKSVASTCGMQLQPMIPEDLTEDEASVWGGEIGQCASEALFQIMSDEFMIDESEACDLALREDGTQTPEAP